MPDRVYSCKATTYTAAPNDAPCENGNSGGLAGRYNFARSFHTGGVQAGLTTLRSDSGDVLWEIDAKTSDAVEREHDRLEDR